MAADVSSLVRLINGADAADSPKSTAPITRDLLEGCTTLDSKELDLDLQVPCGWEKRLDLKSGKVYLQICNPSNSSSSTTAENKSSKAFQDLNFPPSSKKKTLNLFDDEGLDLKLVSLSSSSSTYQSVCTLDKVKSALERAERETTRKRSISMSKSSSPLPLNSSSSIKDIDLDQEERSSSSFAAGCPTCLLYVLISSNNLKCPRCNSNVPLPLAFKKPRIDLNISI
ncbi:hypothetical protein SASPL_123794 [Salvia splendens]|uniref:GIR1-like zinc ribbon domain-containing protein n=1 Tax=Salvia splendens TaxID=180675 RepID=A0A8X8ZTS0_SALSN|nr:uncharacterized protein LOC121742899 [Salvia splendens]KAG6416366.1 hypothetical protein SASPL_123794 [Salvia splendens]